jgi:hypothetical protein
MTPTEAKFDGERGFLVGNGPYITRIKLLRSESKTPEQSTRSTFRENLVWLNLPDQPARLFWCNVDDEWFELDFTPIDKP